MVRSSELRVTAPLRLRKQFYPVGWATALFRDPQFLSYRIATLRYIFREPDELVGYTPTLASLLHHHGPHEVQFRMFVLYKQGKGMRDLALNCQVLILFKGPRDTQQIKVLERQTGSI